MFAIREPQSMEHKGNMDATLDINAATVSHRSIGVVKAASEDVCREWYAQQVLARRFDVRQSPGGPHNPIIALDPRVQRKLPRGTFFLDHLGDTYWLGPHGPQLAGRTGNGSPMERGNRVGRYVQEAGLQADAYARGTADAASFGWADEASAGARTAFSGAPVGRWRQTYGDLHAEELARDRYDEAQRGGARNAGEVTGVVGTLAGGGGAARGAVTAAGRASRALHLTPRIGHMALAGGVSGALAGAGSPGPGQSRIGAAAHGAAYGSLFGPIAGETAAIASRQVPRLINRATGTLAPQLSYLLHHAPVIGEELRPS